MTGWEWVEIPATPKTSEEDQYSGQVVFVFEVDDIPVRDCQNQEKVSGNLTVLLLRQKCREALEKDFIL
jgi:hypothetical protein